MEKQKLNLKNKAIKRQTKCAHKGNLISQPPVQRVSLERDSAERVLRVALTSGWGGHLNHLEVEIERESNAFMTVLSCPALTLPNQFAAFPLRSCCGFSDAALRVMKINGLQ